MVELRELLVSDDYSSRFNKIEEEIKKVISKSRIIFGSYTGHDETHLINVENYVNDIIPDNIKSNLSQEEIFCLLCGIWFHDIGMIPFDNEYFDFESMSKEEREEFRTNVRKDHNIRSGSYILNHKDFFKFSDLEAKAIGKIAKGHRNIDLSKYETILSDSEIRIRSLAAILRLADECDVAQNRESILSQEGIDAKTKEEHFRRHKLIKKVFVSHEKNKLILNCYIYENDDIKILLSTKNKIQKELNEIIPFLTDLNIILNKVDLKVNYDTEYLCNKVLLAIANNEDIFNIKIPHDEIEDSIELLSINNKIIKNNNQWVISEDINIFKNIFVEFPIEDRNNFFFTEYSQNMVKKCFVYIEKLFNADYNINYSSNNYKSRENRISILKISPTAMYLLLNMDKLINDSKFNLRSNQNGVLMIDSILFLGLFNDMYHCAKYINFEDIDNIFKDFNFLDETYILNRIEYCKQLGLEELNE